MATTYDKASLVMIPSGYKDDKLYSVKPADGSGDFTFSRDGAGASPATRVNASGLIEKGRENLLLQSNQFDTTWYDSGVTETSGNSGYDGSNDAWEITRCGSFNYKAQYVTTIGVQSFSTYAKRSSFDFLLIRFQRTASSYAGAYFDLASGIVGSTDGSGVIDSNIESVGGDWYRISITFNESLLRVLYYPVPSDGGVGIGGSGSVFIQDAQLEQGLISTSYIDTTTAPVSAGLLGDMPRLDYSGGATCPSLLLEPSRVNSLPYSEYLGASNWTKTNVAITDNATTSPEGVVNAAQITENASGLNLYSPSDTLVGSASAYTYSAFLKQGSLRYGGIRAIVNGFANRFFVNVDLQEGTITDTDTTGTGVTWSYDIENYGNGWHRVWISATNTSGNIDLAIGLSNSATPTYASGLPYYTGTGSDYIYAYGCQIESGSYPTSYIPTYGSASTRAKDFFVMNLITNGITTPIQTEATLFVEFEKPNTGENVDLMRWKGTGTLGRAYLYNTAAGWASDWGSSQQLNIGIGNNKVAWRLDSLTSGTDFVNGTKGTGSSGTAWSDIRELRFNAEGGGGVLRVKQILLFPTALTDAECISLTTL